MIAAATDYVANDPTTPAQIAALIPQLLAAGQCTNPATDCVVLAQQVLVGNAAALPQIQGAGTVAGVNQSHIDAANQVRFLAGLPISSVLAAGLIPVLPALPDFLAAGFLAGTRPFAFALTVLTAGASCFLSDASILYLDVSI